MQDLRAVVKKTSTFLGKSLTESQIDELLEKLSFKEMAKTYNEADEQARASGFFNQEGHFLRKGKQ